MDILKLPDVYRQNRDISPTTFQQLWNVAKMITRFAGGKLDTKDLSSDLV
jgi:hypothetical protein